MVVDQFWVKFQSAFGLGLVLRNFCIKEMLGFWGDAIKIFQNPCFCFCHWSSLIQIELFKFMNKLDF